jgi:hypothetical protein
VTRAVRALLTATVLVAELGCGPAREQEAAVPVLETVDAATRPVSDASRSVPVIDGRTLVETAAVPGRPVSFVLSRETQLTKAPCSGCHNVPLAALRWTGADGRKRAHWAVEMAHAPAAVMQCETCHAVDDAGSLKFLEGQLVGFDHAYQTCAQCHSSQAADWSGGAHGKQVGGWASPRAVYNCTECHDPHRPELLPRWPARAARLQDEATAP